MARKRRAWSARVVEALILAAGLGTRLGNLTRDVPKALIPVAGIPVLERVARRLIEAGADHLIINTHHHADQIVEYVTERGSFGVEVAFSHEPDRPLETGGGVAAAAHLFRGDAPFIIHNADIVSGVPLRDLYDRHQANSPLATLAVMERASSRKLLFDEAGLQGRLDEGRGIRVEARSPRGEVKERAFGGIHVVSPLFLELVSERGAFSILEPYLRLAGEGYRIEPYSVDGHPWVDIGKPGHVAEAERLIERYNL